MKVVVVVGSVQVQMSGVSLSMREVRALLRSCARIAEWDSGPDRPAGEVPIGFSYAAPDGACEG